MKADQGLGPLQDGSRVVIIGGGPGGTACALRLQCLAAEMGRNIQIILVESKQFSGEHHYNQCAGVLSIPLPDLLEHTLRVPFPFHLSRSFIKGYFLQTRREEILLRGEEADSIALRRVQFDAYMLQKVIESGVQVVHARATDLEFHKDKVIVYTENMSYGGDIVVGAFGLDEGSGTLFARHTGYRPPNALSSIVTKYHPGPEGMEAFGPYIHAFLPAHPKIEFGAITPKGNHLTINIAGRQVDSELLKAFLEMPKVKAALPELDRAGTEDPNDLSIFKGRFPCSEAKRYYGDRYVMVGDAAGLVRAFKGKGVTTAVQTGIRAAETIFSTGISVRAFDEHYRKENQDIIRDLPYGRLMRMLTISMARFGLLDPVIRAARNEKQLQVALYDAVSAHAPYQQVIAHTLHPHSVAAIIRAFLGAETPDSFD